MKKRILSLAMVLALVAVLVMPMAAMATGTTTEVTGAVTTGYLFSAPTAVSLSNMAPSATPHQANSTDGSLSGNLAVGYDVTGTDANTVAASTGRMWVGGTAAAPTAMIAAALKIGPATDPNASAATAVNFYSVAGIANAAVISLFVSQVVAYTDPVASGYTITITFTVAPKS